MNSKDIEKWIELQTTEFAKQFPNNPDLKYASLCGRLEGKLMSLFAGDAIKEAAIQRMKEDLEVVQ